MTALVLDTYMQTFASAVKVTANVDHILAMASDSLLKKSAIISSDKVTQYIEATHSILGKVQTAIAESEHLQEVMQILSGLVGASSASYPLVSYRHDVVELLLAMLQHCIAGTDGVPLSDDWAPRG